jgi:hypothetical protein
MRGDIDVDLRTSRRAARCLLVCGPLAAVLMLGVGFLAWGATGEFAAAGDVEKAATAQQPAMLAEASAAGNPRPAPARTTSSGAQEASSEVIPLAHFAPADAPLYLEVRSIREVDAALRRAHAWRLLPLLAGSADAAAPAVDLTRSLQDFLGPGSRINIRDILQANLAIVSDSWTDPQRAVWLIRVQDPSLLDTWFPESERRKEHQRGALRFFRTPAGVIVCLHEDILMLGRSQPDHRLPRDTLTLVTSRRGRSLADLPTYQRLADSVAPDRLATVFALSADDEEAASATTAAPGHSGSPSTPVDEPAAESPAPKGPTTNDESSADADSVPTDGTTEEADGTPSIAPPPGEDASDATTHENGILVAVYEGNGRLDLAVRQIGGSSGQTRLSSDAIAKVRVLPATTLAVYAGAASVGGKGAGSAASASAIAKVGDRWHQLQAILRALAFRESAAGAADAQLGSEFLLVLGQDLRVEGSHPVPAMFVACEGNDPQALRDRLGENISRLAEALIRRQGGLNGSFVTEQDRYFGVDLLRLRWRWGDDATPSGNLAWLNDLEFCLAVRRPWLIITVSREHMCRLLEAEAGLAPRFGEVDDVFTLREPAGGWSTVYIAQPNQAAEVINDWSRHLMREKPSWLEGGFWLNPQRGRQLGIGMRVQQDPGVVIVARVYPDTVADGALLVGDRIVGIDGQLLDLTLPNRDLRRRLEESTREEGPVLRVWRQDRLLDVPLDTRPSHGQDALGLLLEDPQAFLRDLLAVARTMRFLSVAVEPADESGTALNIAVRFEPARP